MAVSMNSGFMRSDFMISDAALPMRMEELEQLEQTAKFAEILGGIGGAPAGEAQQAPTETGNEVVMTDADVPTEEMTFPNENSVVLSKSELKALARAVVNGEIKLEEIPTEMRTDILMMVIAMMMAGIPEDEIPALQETPAIDSVSTATAEVVQNVIAKLENASDKTTELNELLSGFASVQDETVVVPQEETVVFEEAVTQLFSANVQPEQDVAENAQPTQDAGEQSIDVKLPEMSDKGAKQFADMEYIPSEVAETQAQTAAAAPTQETSGKQTETQQAAALEAVTAQTVVEPQAAQQEGTAQGDSQSFAKAQKAPVQTGTTENTSAAQTEFEQLRNVISEVRVTKEPQSQQTEQQSFTATQDIRTGESTKGRVVSKSDELMMLKNAAKPTEAQPEAMQTVIPQGIEQPTVIYTRTDGTQLEVKPEEVLKQVADNIIQQAASTNAEGETEYSVTLTPEDLGSITVRMTKTVDGTFNVSITADNARTQRIIEESGLAIQNSLRQNGIELESWQTVNESEQQERAEDYNGSSKNPYYHEEQSENEEAEDTTFAELISAM